MPGVAEVFHARIEDYGYPTHYHDTWTVLIVDDGAIRYDLDTRQRVSAGNTISVLPPGVAHNGTPAPGAISFSKRVVYLDAAVIPVDLVGAAVDRSHIDDGELRRGIETLHSRLRNGDDFAAESSLALVAERIETHLAASEPRQLKSEPDTARRLRLLLDAHPTADITLDAAAAELHRSKAHLVRSFSASYGISPHAYLVSRQIETARRLLLEGQPPATVAAMSGFYDQAHLTRHFKRHTSTTPSAFQGSRRVHSS